MGGTGGNRNAVMASGLASFVLLGVTQAVFGPALPVYQQHFGLTTAAAGWLISAFWVGCFLGVVGMYLGAGRIGPRPGLGAIALGALMMALAGWWPAVLAGGVIFGAGYGSLAAVFNPRILAAFGPRGPAMLSLLNAIFSLGAIATPLIFLALGGSPRATLLLAAGLAAAIWLGSGRVGSGAAGPAAGAALPGFRFHWPILGFGMLAIGMEATLVTLGPTALIRAGSDATRAAQLLSMFYLAYLVARTGMIFVAARTGPFTVYVAAMAFAALCAAGAVFISPLWFFPPMGISASLFFQGFFVPAVRKMGDDARVPSVVIAAGLVGAIVMPLICAQAMAGLGPRGFFWLILIWAGAVLAAALPMARGLNAYASGTIGTRPAPVSRKASLPSITTADIGPP